jgi:hypothetical protein
MTNAIAAALVHGMPGQPSGSVANGILASQAWSVARYTRRFVNNLLKTLNSNGTTSVSEGTFTTLFALGRLGSVENAAGRGGFLLSSPEDVAASAYNALGIFKFAGDVMSGLAKEQIGQALAAKVGILTNALNKLANLSKYTWFKGVNSAFFGAGALANFLQAGLDFDNGDEGAGVAEIFEGVGGSLRG